MRKHRCIEFEELSGKTLVDIKINSEKTEMEFTDSEGCTYLMYHDQDCCEDVYIEDVCGNTENLLNSPLLIAEEINNVDEEPLSDCDESYTWTYYKLATVKGYVTIRWFGTSNGYYSESVTFVKCL